MGTVGQPGVKVITNIARGWKTGVLIIATTAPVMAGVINERVDRDRQPTNIYKRTARCQLLTSVGVLQYCSVIQYCTKIWHQIGAY